MIVLDIPEQTRYEIQCHTFLVSGTLLLLGGIVSYVVIQSGLKWDLWFPAVDYTLEGTPDLIAGSLFTEWILPFEIISILLIVATAAAIALAYDTKPRKKL